MYDVTPLHVHLIYSRAHDLLADLQLDLVPARQRLLHGVIELRLALPPEILHFPAFDVERANGQDKPGIFKYLRLKGGRQTLEGPLTAVSKPMFAKNGKKY